MTQASWFGSEVGSCLALFRIHQVKRIKSRRFISAMMTALDSVLDISVIIIIIIHCNKLHSVLSDVKEALLLFQLVPVIIMDWSMKKHMLPVLISHL